MYLCIVIFVFVLFFSYIGLKVIGNLDGKVEYDPYASNFDSFMNAFSVIYTMLTYDGYPDNILPAYSTFSFNFLDYSKMYLFYFMVFLNLNIFLFQPVPVSIIFEQYLVTLIVHLKKNRCRIAVQDRILEREQLLSAYIALDVEE